MGATPPLCPRCVISPGSASVPATSSSSEIPELVRSVHLIIEWTETGVLSVLAAQSLLTTSVSRVSREPSQSMENALRVCVTQPEQLPATPCRASARANSSTTASSVTRARMDDTILTEDVWRVPAIL